MDIIAIIILAVIGLGWDNFFAGVKKGRQGRNYITIRKRN
jgi:putative Mn2+ efflux pump MntP